MRWVRSVFRGLIQPSPASIWTGGALPDCESCKAGALLSFTWGASSGDETFAVERSAFVRSTELRYGALYECKSCGQPWYLSGPLAVMHVVPQHRLELIYSWNRQPTTLPREQRAVLARIVPTPRPEVYGVPQETVETPCAVRTVQGERFEAAIVTIQQHAPFESWRSVRLAADIAAIEPSRYALPLRIRRAAAKAKEVAMGFAPTVIELPDGRRWTLNGRQSFFVEDGVSPTEFVLARSRPSSGQPTPPIHTDSEDVVYFVADK